MDMAHTHLIMIKKKVVRGDVSGNVLKTSHLIWICLGTVSIDLL